MRKIIYWSCECLDDGQAYNIRAKTKREAIALKAQYPYDAYGPPKKICIQYKDIFNLVCELCGEGGNIYEFGGRDVEDDS